MLSLAALLIAAAQPAAGPAPAAPPAAAADADSVFALFESVCLSNGAAPAGFEPAEWSSFPPLLRLMNTYDHSGAFFRRAEPETYLARSEGPHHGLPGIERRCGVAARGIETASIIERLTRRAQAEKTSVIERNEAKMTLIAGRGGIFDVISVEDGWVMVRAQEILIRVDSVPRRARKGKRN